MQEAKTSSIVKDVLNIFIFIVLVILGTVFINAFVFRSFSVTGPSMEPTLYTNDRLIVNRIPVTWGHAQSKEYLPERGQVIVFRNPLFDATRAEEFIVKRVVGLPGERVVVQDGRVAVFNDENPRGFFPDLEFDGPTNPTSGDIDRTVPNDEIFVIGDHRQDNFSLDSRNGLSTIPLKDVVGPVAFRIFPFGQIRTF